MIRLQKYHKNDSKYSHKTQTYLTHLVSKKYNKFYALKICSLLFLTLNLANAEPNGFFFGVGVGAGRLEAQVNYTHLAGNPFTNSVWHQKGFRLPGETLHKYGVTYDFSLGYKHFTNNWFGGRYYALVGFQHASTEFTKNIALIDYTFNADMLLNYYSNDSFSGGFFAGIGVGGMSFYSKAIDEYKKRWNWSDADGKVYKHHVSAHVNAGLRFEILQKVKKTSQRVLEDTQTQQKGDKKITTKRYRVPYFTIGHGIEILARVPVTKYRATNERDDINVSCSATTTNKDCYTPKPSYTISNPYKIEARYIISF